MHLLFWTRKKKEVAADGINMFEKKMEKVCPRCAAGPRVTWVPKTRNMIEEGSQFL